MSGAKLFNARAGLLEFVNWWSDHQSDKVGALENCGRESEYVLLVEKSLRKLNVVLVSRIPGGFEAHLRK
jgi:hypothetical protein